MTWTYHVKKLTLGLHLATLTGSMAMTVALHCVLTHQQMNMVRKL